jgi:hypothetical protein
MSILIILTVQWMVIMITYSFRKSLHSFYVRLFQKLDLNIFIRIRNRSNIFIIKMINY